MQWRVNGLETCDTDLYRTFIFFFFVFDLFPPPLSFCLLACGALLAVVRMPPLPAPEGYQILIHEYLVGLTVAVDAPHAALQKPVHIELRLQQSVEIVERYVCRQGRTAELELCAVDPPLGNHPRGSA